MKQYEIWYWSTCGSVEATMQEIKAQGLIAATDKLKKRLAKEHKNMKFEYRAYYACTLHGDMHV